MKALMGDGRVNIEVDRKSRSRDVDIDTRHVIFLTEANGKGSNLLERLT